MRDRWIQLACGVVMVVGVTASGTMVPRLLQKAQEQELRYTADPVEGAPPIVALGTAIGALRGIIADYLWIKLQSRKEQGLFYEAMADADLITKLQPRFAEVWGFHGHNMAYNISVLTNTPEERWAWVNAGIDLVRNRGLRYNPNDLGLNKELAFWFAHKIDGVADDAHLHYKRELAREWHFLLGAPPMGQQEREAWLRQIAEAPDSIQALEAQHPQVKALEESLTRELSPFDRRFGFKLDREFLLNVGRWQASKGSPYARILGLDRRFAQNDPIYAAFDRVLGDPANQEATARLLAFLRKKVLREDYNMDPSLMADYTRDYGPFDWRHPQSHAFYFSRLGADSGADRYAAEDDVYKVLNNDRLAIQAMQALNHSGMMGVDPFSTDNPTRMHDNRWIKPIERYFRDLYQKHYKVRGAGGDTFIDFHENFMAQAIRQLYRAGDVEGAQEILGHLDELYGRGGLIPNEKYNKGVEEFVRDNTYGEYEMVPDVARTDVYAALQRGIREGLLLGNQKVMDEAMKYARELTEYFQSTRYTDFVNKFGERRMADLVGDLRQSVETVFQSLLLDRGQPLLDRLVMYNRAGDDLKRLAYDAVREQVAMELAEGPLGGVYRVEEVLPEPPGMEEYRRVQAELAERRQREVEEQNRAGALRK
ncbi:MAG: hypothetical protein RLZZ558_1640 [Planctomycetota bacterium]|jgi:hypothetical protein